MGCTKSRIVVLLVPHKGPYEYKWGARGLNIRVFGGHVYENEWSKWKMRPNVVRIGKPVAYGTSGDGVRLVTTQYIYGDSSDQLLGYLEISDTDVPKKLWPHFKKPVGTQIGYVYTEGIHQQGVPKTVVVHYGDYPSERPP